jgi:hydroxyethylthiazole kinase-like uncharacterized protein yjeF
LTGGLTRSASAEQARALDAASRQLGTSEEALMALAGFQCARLVQIILAELGRDGPVAVLAGRGNNGGDALGCARHLAAWGTPVRTVTLASLDVPESPSSRQARAATASGVDLRQVSEDPQETLTWALLGASLTVDGLLGTGSSGPLRGMLAEAVRQVNAAGTPVLAIDLPSGLEASGGGTNRDAVRADDTLMLAIPKRGCLVKGAHAFVGRLWLADIGVPAQAYRDSGLMPPLFSADGLQRYERSA